jgi:putative spermidine/putrescine transport system ATP-binding protein
MAVRRPQAGQLSGGQRQRVALARALVIRPEGAAAGRAARRARPQAARADAGRAQAIQREVGITFVFVTHDQEEALTMSDRIAVFNDGRIEQVGRPPRSTSTRDRVRGRVRRHVHVLTGRAAVDLIGGGHLHGPPERIRLTTPDRGGRADRGTIAEVVYLGADHRYLIDLEAGRGSRE